MNTKPTVFLNIPRIPFGKIYFRKWIKSKVWASLPLKGWIISENGTYACYRCTKKRRQTAYNEKNGFKSDY